MNAPTEPTQIPLTRLRGAIARSMTASALVPQFTIEADADLRALVELRARAKEQGEGFSYSDVFTAACAHALVEHPNVNASFYEKGIIQHSEVNVGIAISLADGLVAPAILNANCLDVAELASERLRLTAAANNGTLTPQDLLSATFTISNLGPLGVRRFRALIVPPQAAILGVGKVTLEVQCSLSLSCDHRVLDGAPAARFLARVIDRLEQPGWLTELL